MSTSADCALRGGGRSLLRDGGRVLLPALPYADPLAHHFVEQVQQEYVQRYGGRDAAVVEPGEFEPPLGLFLVAEVDGTAAGCGGWRTVADGRAEIKRVYVEPAFRRRGLAQVIVDALETSAARAGHRWIVLNSGDRQPEALALYEAAGYRPVPGYGPYACSPRAVFLGKDLGTDTGTDTCTDTGTDIGTDIGTGPGSGPGVVVDGATDRHEGDQPWAS